MVEDLVSWQPDETKRFCPASVEVLTHRSRIFMRRGDPGFKQVKSLGDQFFLFDRSGMAVGRIEKQVLARAVAGIREQ